MGKSKRVQLIKRIESQRKSRVISYLTSTRPNIETQMAIDAVRIVYEHIKDLKGEAIDLFLSSNGGDGTVPWRLVTLIREYASRFSVLIPFRAFSAATLTAIGADEIVMHPMGMLGPTDPKVSNEFNPRDPASKKAVGINVEDVTAYLALIQEDGRIHHEDELVVAFKCLADQVHPLALGNVKRSLAQSRMMAKKLLSLHLDAVRDEHKIAEIVDNLTSKLYYHGHPINRIEARNDIGLENVVHPPVAVEKAMWELYAEYETEMKSDQPFDPAMEFLEDYPDLPAGGKEISQTKATRLAFVESRDRSDSVVVEYRLAGKVDHDGNTSVNVLFSKRKWCTE